MPPKLKKRVYSDGCGSAFEFAVRGKRNATLKNSVPFVDESYPDLVFLIPKQTARLWRFAGGGGDSISEEPIEASVYVKKGGMGGSTWLLDLETGARLSLCRPSSLVDDGGDMSIQRKKKHGRDLYDGDGDDSNNNNDSEKPRSITKHKKYAMQREFAARAAERGFDVAVEFIKMAKGGRQADITLLVLGDV